MSEVGLRGNVGKSVLGCGGGVLWCGKAGVRGRVGRDEKRCEKVCWGVGQGVGSLLGCGEK